MKTQWKKISLMMFLSVQFHSIAQAQNLEDEFSEGQSYEEALPNTAISRRVVYRNFTEGSLFHLEPAFGVNSTNFTGGTGNYSFDASNGYQAGINLLIGRSHGFEFETGLLYSERGGKEKYNSGSSYYATQWQMQYKLKYLEVPLLARYNFQISRGLDIFVKGGVVVGFLQDASGDISNVQNYYYNSYYNYSSNSSSNIKDYFSSMDTRWVAGLGTSVSMTRSLSWVLQVDYQAGLNKISSTQPNGYYGTTNMDLYMNSLNLSTGLNFNL